MPAQSIAQIQRQIARLQAKAKAIENASNNKKAKAVQKVRQLMDKLGVTLADMGNAAPSARGPAGKGRGKSTGKSVGKKSARKNGAKTPVPIRYRDPETGNTWTGRGRPPVWLAERIKAGKTKEQYLIATPAGSTASA
jgi:DNA-binding protein H-NS